jgi:hypothetical protein
MDLDECSCCSKSGRLDWILSCMRFWTIQGRHKTYSKTRIDMKIDAIIGTFVSSIVSSSSAIHDAAMDAFRDCLVAASNLKRILEETS